MLVVKEILNECIHHSKTSDTGSPVQILSVVTIGVVELSLFDCFLFSLSPGLCPDWEDWNPKNAKKNAKEAMDNAEKWLDIPQV